MKLKDWWFITATNYACLILVFAVFDLLGLTAPPINAATLLQAFVLIGSIALSQLLLNWWGILDRVGRTPWRQVVADALVRCLLCFALVLGVGMPIGLVPATWASVWFVVPIIIPVFLTVYAITYLNFRRTQKDADFINNKIGSRK